MGYSHTFCSQCEIQPLGGIPKVIFKKDALTIRQYADCSDALTPKTLTFTSIPYKAGGSSVVKLANYEAVFTHIKKTDCPLLSCSLMTSGSCGAALS